MRCSGQSDSRNPEREEVRRLGAISVRKGKVRTMGDLRQISRKMIGTPKVNKLVQIGVGKRKNVVGKRDTLKRKTVDREIQRVLRDRIKQKGSP